MIGYKQNKEESKKCDNTEIKLLSNKDKRVKMIDEIEIIIKTAKRYDNNP